MRQIVLDTETTGLEVEQGHRIIEIGCVELLDRKVTTRNYHQYINPERKIDEGAISVHGITNEALKDEPLFIDIADQFIAFVKDAELIIHNADFDVGFINAELDKLGGYPKIEDICTITDSLKMARHTFPGQRNSLDALCKRYDIDNSARTLHGALLDAEILADVYLMMTGGQTHLFGSAQDRQNQEQNPIFLDLSQYKTPLIKADEQSLVEHQKWLDFLDAKSESGALWNQLETKH